MTPQNLYDNLTPLASPHHVHPTECPKMIEYRFMLVSPSLQMAALPIASMLKAANELNINFSGDYKIGTDSYKRLPSVKCYDMAAQMLDSDSLAKIYNSFQVNLIARRQNAKYIETFEGFSYINDKYYYLSTNQSFSLLDALRQYPTTSELAYMMLQLLKAVGELHTLGFAHGNL